MDNIKKPKAEIEIDLVELTRKLWDNRKFILKVTVIFAMFGLFVAIFSAKEYTSSVTMVPQLSSNKSNAGGLASLAAMAGINLGDIGGNEVLSPTTYPLIMQSVLFQKELMQTLVNFDNIPQSISLYDYYTNDRYQTFHLFSFLSKYTIGLPGVILKAIKGDVKADTMKTKSLYCLEQSQKESNVSELLTKSISLTINQKEGTITLSANMPEALASTQVVEAARLLLQKYITEFKIDKVQQNLDFINDRYVEAKLDFEKKQQRLAEFRDANHNVILALSRAREEQLNSEYNLSFNVYSELAKQLEQAKIRVKEKQPVLTVIKPAVVPLQKSKPNRPFIITGFVVLGMFLSSVYLLIKFVLFKWTL